MKLKTIKCLKILMLLMITICVGCLCACEKEQRKDTATLTINQEEIVLDFYEQAEVDYSYNGKENPVITVADSSIITVNGKTIKAIKSGITTITLTAGKLTDSCTVKVNEINDELFSLETEENLVLYVMDNKQLSGNMIYDRKVVSEAVLDYTTLDSEIVSLQNGIVTANGVGDAQIIVTGTYQNVTKNKIVNVRVIPVGEVEFLNNAIELYPLASYRGTEYQNSVELKYVVKEKQTVVSSPENVEILVNNDNVCVEDGFVVANKVGESVITVKYTGTDGVEVLSQITATVSIIEVTNDDLPMLNLTKNKTNLNTIVLSEYFDQMVTVNDLKTSIITDGVIKNQVSFSDGKIDCQNLPLDGACELVLATDKVKSSVPVFIWTDSIEDSDDLQSLRTVENGCYYLVSNINMANVEWTDNGDKEFKGLLDGKDFNGNKYVIENFNASCGLFNSLGNGAEIRNVTFVNATLCSLSKNVGVMADMVVAGATVNISFTSTSAILNGDSCGGVIGAIASTAKINFFSSYLNVYAPKLQTNCGAFVGGADGTVNFDLNNKVYTSLNLCGDGKMDGIENSSKNVINDLNKISPIKAFDEAVSFNIAGENKGITIPDFQAGESFSLFANGYRQGTVAIGGNVELVSADVKEFTGDHIEILVKSGNDVKYYTIDVKGHLEISSLEAFEYLKIIENGEVYLKTDIDYQGKIWETTANFKGEFNGEGHTIKNIQFKGCGLFKSFGGKLKDLVMRGVVLDGINSAAVASLTLSSCEFLNILVEFNASQNINSWGTLQGGLIERVSSEADVLTVQNAIIIKNETNIWFGYVAGYRMGTANLQNVHFVGPNELLRADRDIATGQASETSTYTFYTDMKELHNNINMQGSTIQLSKFVVDAYNDCCNESFIYISDANKTDLLNESKMNGKTVYLASNIDLSDITWSTTVAFNGTLDGQGYSINGLTLENGSGLFKSARGTIKNIVINIALENGATGAIAHTMDGTLTLENVYINLESRSGYRFGGIVYNVSSYLLTLNNVVVDLPKSSSTASCALIAGNVKQKYKDVILEEIRSNYGKMLKEGSTTAWETTVGQADFANAGSLCHGWSAYPIYIYNELGLVKQD